MEWRKIPGYEEYEISSTGEVRRGDNIRVVEIDKDGYKRLGLWKGGICKNYRVCRLVGLAFIPNPDNKPTIDHMNRDITDDRIENLRWATSSEQAINRNNRVGISGHKNIHITGTDTFIVRVKRSREWVYNKTFKTLQEAIDARNNYLISIEN